MTRQFIRAIRPNGELGNYPAHSADIAEYLYGNRKAKIPASGFAPIQMQGITIWANPLTARPHLVRNFQLRVMCNCPVCGKQMALGRLWQHSKIHA